MARKTLKQNVQALGLRTALRYLDRDPQENIPKLLNWMVKADCLIPRKGGRDAFKITRESLRDRDGNWYTLATSLWPDIDGGIRRRLFENFVVNATIVGYRRQCQVKEEHGCNVPWAILLDPTSACNLKCLGCWAAEYGDKLSMSLDTLDDIINQGENLGVCMYIYSGGEPLIRKKDIITLCERHPECQFLAFTNGTLIDEQFADDMVRVKNFIPAISIEGFEEATDARRGQGTFAKVQKAMAILKEHRMPFGVSCCYTSQNTDSIGSDEFIDFLVDQGCKFAWFFTFMPVGKDSPTELMVSAEQRKFMYDKVREWRHTKPIFTMDF